MSKTLRERADEWCNNAPGRVPEHVRESLTVLLTEVHGTADKERLDWLDSEDGVVKFILALTKSLPPAVEAELVRHNVDLKKCSVRDLIDALKQG